MKLIIDLPSHEEALARNRERWVEVVSDPQWRDHPYRIETNGFGQIVMTPPPSVPHGSRQYRIARLLDEQTQGHVVTECPVITSDGVKAIDVAGFTRQRYATIRGCSASEIAPEICVEVISPSNTKAEMRTKRVLYFDAGAEECWQCDTEGHMSYYHAKDPDSPTTKSQRCPDFPNQIEA